MSIFRGVPLASLSSFASGLAREQIRYGKKSIIHACG